VERREVGLQSEQSVALRKMHASMLS
jgi:hypothetical protein